MCALIKVCTMDSSLPVSPRRGMLEWSDGPTVWSGGGWDTLSGADGKGRFLRPEVAE